MKPSLLYTSADNAITLTGAQRRACLSTKGEGAKGSRRTSRADFPDQRHVTNKTPYRLVYAPTPNVWPKAADQSFTLIELLTIVALISILMLLLSPALRSARDKARQINCLSNLKQLYGAAIQYSQDNEGCILPYLNNAGYDWSSILSKVPPGNVVYLPPITTSKKCRQVFHCPSEPSHSTADRNGQAISWTPATDYGMNKRVSWGIYDGWGLNEQPRSLSDVWDPSRHFMFCDSAWYFLDPGTFLVYVDYRHSGGLNLIFFDGHGEWLQEPLPASSDTFPW
ncbi:MAG: hypothetical protein PHV34_09120 [Verrucomicrobiae bacterium]|nr:hypothetical protein [Verrucomicrobiae bacterium]